VRGAIVVEGRGLHAGAVGRVTFAALAARDGQTTFNGEPLARWHAVPAERSTAIACGELRARTVEHLFAALAARGLQRGLAVRLEGDEPPILDGGAAEWMDAIERLGVLPAPPGIAVAHEAIVEVGQSRYTFTPSDRVQVEIELESDDPRLSRHAEWGGEPADFRVRIASARTFCFAHEVDELARRGLASHVRPESVIVVGADILVAGRPFESDEPARHKLLDLTGDLFLYGGPPRGRVVAMRPGHSATHEAMRIAIGRGILVPLPAPSTAG
jgi:UDP-3-O-[3-hydroxymyristoyl] N-acetylglucosamine deacetylase